MKIVHLWLNKKRSVLTSAACRDELDDLNFEEKGRHNVSQHVPPSKGSAVIEQVFALALRRMLGEWL